MRATLVPDLEPQPRSGRTDIILNLRDIDRHSLPLVGRKAFHLGMLLNAGFTVPAGFCVTSEAAGHDRSEHLSLDVREAITAAWRHAAFSMAAVRSSAIEEDSYDASWAGVFPTVLPVCDEVALLAAVEECFRALHGCEAAQYRGLVGKATAVPAMAVLVQELVDAEAAGIMFTAHPVTGARDDVFINAVRGLGEPLAAGRITGDSFVVGRDGRIKTRTLTSKPFMQTPRGELPLRNDQCERASLTDAQLTQLSRMAVEIEALFGGPQDIEFAICGEIIHILQARPIAGMQSISAPSDAEIDAYVARERYRLNKRVAQLRRQGRLTGADVVFSNGNIGELLPTPTPMSFGVFRAIFAGCGGAIVEGRRSLGYRVAEDTAEPLYELICGQPSFNVEIDAQTFDIGLPLDIADILAGIAENPERANYPEFGLYHQCYGFEEAVARYGTIAGRRIYAQSQRVRAGMAEAAANFLARFPGSIEQDLNRGLATSRQVIAAISSHREAELIDAFWTCMDHLKRTSCVLFVVAARLGFYFADMLRWRLLRHFGSAALAAPLLQGLDGSRITDQAFDLERLAHGQMDCAAFLELYGHMSVNELELALPRLAEEREALALLLGDLTRSERRPAKDFDGQRKRRLAAEAELARRLAAEGVSAQDAAELAEDLRFAQAFLPLRETVKYYYTAEYAVLRAILCEINKRRGWANGDVFYLLPEELTHGFAANAALARLIRRRRRHHRIAHVLTRRGAVPPVVFASRLEALGAPVEATAARQLRGAPVAGGTAVGIVRLLENTELRSTGIGLRGNEVIVTRSANLGLAPLLRMAAGLIVEVGGVLAHAACQARESGIPAVVMVGATAALQNGMRVRIDGGSGLIEVLDDKT